MRHWTCRNCRPHRFTGQHPLLPGGIIPLRLGQPDTGNGQPSPYYCSQVRSEASTGITTGPIGSCVHSGGRCWIALSQCSSPSEAMPCTASPTRVLMTTADRITSKTGEWSFFHNLCPTKALHQPACILPRPASSHSETSPLCQRRWLRSPISPKPFRSAFQTRSEEHTSELQSLR